MIKLFVASVTLCIALSQLQACSSRQVYESAKMRNQVQCQQLPPSQYEECMQQAGETYDDYKDKRDSVEKPEMK